VRHSDEALGVLTVLLSPVRAGVATKTFAAHLHDIGHLLQILTAHPETFRDGSDAPSAASTALGGDQKCWIASRLDSAGRSRSPKALARPSDDSNTPPDCRTAILHGFQIRNHCIRSASKPHR